MRLIKWFFLLLAVAILFCACGQEENAPDDTTVPVETAAPAPDIDLVAGGEAQYVIVRPEECTPAEQEAAAELRALIEELTGVSPKLTTDWVKRGQSYDSTTREILLGHCGQSETAEVLSTLGYGQYAIRPVGNKIVVAAWSDDAFSAAMSVFRNLLRNSKTENGLSLPGDLNMVKSTDPMVDILPPYTGGELKTVINCDDDNQMLYVSKTTEDEFRAYCGSLAGLEGFSLYTEREEQGNLFATYAGEKYSIHTYFTAADKETRVIIEPKNVLPLRAEDVKNEGKYEPAVCMVGLEYNYTGKEFNPIGLLMMFRLPDGQLIVVDGGGMEVENADIVYENLKNFAPDPSKITIAAWVFTHIHGDHSGGFVQFMSKYSGRVTIEQFIHNITPKAQQVASNDVGQAAATRSKMELYDAPAIKAHTGQVFHFGGAELEILYTVEDYAPDLIDNLNSSSLIFRVTMGGQSVMVLGDATREANTIACRMWGDYLKADFVQISHHGMVGGTEALYNHIRAEVSLWPTAGWKYEELRERPENVRAAQLSKDLFIAGDDVNIFILPYTPVGNNPKFAG